MEFWNISIVYCLLAVDFSMQCIEWRTSFLSSHPLSQQLKPFWFHLFSRRQLPDKIVKTPMEPSQVFLSLIVQILFRFFVWLKFRLLDDILQIWNFLTVNKLLPNYTHKGISSVEKRQLNIPPVPLGQVKSD